MAAASGSFFRPPARSRARTPLFAAIGLVFAVLVAMLQGELLPEARTFRPFDSLAVSFLHGRASVEKDLAGKEACVIKGRHYMYTAPFPALARIPALLAAPQFEGRWQTLFCLAAALLAVGGFRRLVHDSLEANYRLDAVCRFRLECLFTAAFALASPVFFLVSATYIWHESMLWALAFSIWALVHFNAIVLRDEPSACRLLGFGSCTALAFLSRLTFGLPLLLLSAALFVRLLRDTAGAAVPDSPTCAHCTGRAWRRSALLAPLFIAALFQGWYNHQRYGAFWIFDRTNCYTKVTHLREHQFKTARGVFNPARIPVAAYNYFLKFEGLFSKRAPFMHMTYFKNSDPPLIFPDYQEGFVPFTLAAPWLLAGAMLGLRTIIRRGLRSLAALAILLLAVQPLLILSFSWITQRYLAEFLPLSACLLSAALQDFRPSADSKRRLALNVALLGILIFSTIVNWATTISWATLQTWHTSPPQRFKFLRAYEVIDRWSGELPSSTSER